MRLIRRIRVFVLIPVAGTALFAGVSQGLLGGCGPFGDVAADSFCPFVLEIFCLGITNGTTPTTYAPASNVNRLQMATFLSRTVDVVLKRGSRRAAYGQFWTPQNSAFLRRVRVGWGYPNGDSPVAVRFDGQDLWTANAGAGSSSRVRASDGKWLETWTGASGAQDILVGGGYVYILGHTLPGRLYRIDPSQAAGAVTTVASNLANDPNALAFDGTRIWTTGSLVSIVTPGASLPWTVTTVNVTAVPYGIVYDGANIWVSDTNGTLRKLDGAGAVLQTVNVGQGPSYPVFDGANIWAPHYGVNSVSVVRASNGAVLATLTGQGLNHPIRAAFDGERVLVTNVEGHSVSLWKAADLTAIGNYWLGSDAYPQGACSDGVGFWVTADSTSILRF